MTAITVFLTFLLLVVVLVAVAWGGFLVHRRMIFLEVEYRRICLAAVEDTQHFEKQFQELLIRIENAERRAADAAQHPSQSVNYTQRSQMLRMLRRGDPPEKVANALAVPLSQIRLLMKLPGVAAAKQKAAGP